MSGANGYGLPTPDPSTHPSDGIGDVHDPNSTDDK